MRWLRPIGLMLLVAAVLLISRPADSTQAARNALTDAGLGHIPQAADRAVHLDTHGGFHGDGCTVTVFEVAQNAADALWASLPDAEGWHISPIPLADYTAMLPACSCHPGLYPAPDTVFDAWFQREDLPGFNCTTAFFDRETGAFFYFRRDI